MGLKRQGWGVYETGEGLHDSMRYSRAHMASNPQLIVCCHCRKSINRSGPGFGYGFLVAFCFTLAFFCLLVGLIMDSFKNTVEDNLTGCECCLCPVMGVCMKFVGQTGMV